MLTDESVRLECLRLAHERLGPEATHEDLFVEARRLIAFVQRLERVEVSGTEYYGRTL